MVRSRLAISGIIPCCVGSKHPSEMYQALLAMCGGPGHHGHPWVPTYRSTSSHKRQLRTPLALDGHLHSIVSLHHVWKHKKDSFYPPGEICFYILCVMEGDLSRSPRSQHIARSTHLCNVYKKYDLTGEKQDLYKSNGNDLNFGPGGGLFFFLSSKALLNTRFSALAQWESDPSGMCLMFSFKRATVFGFLRFGIRRSPCIFMISFWLDEYVNSRELTRRSWNLPGGDPREKFAHNIIRGHLSSDIR